MPKLKKNTKSKVQSPNMTDLEACEYLEYISIDTFCPEKFKRARRTLCFTQEKFAQAVKVSLTSLNSWENNHTKPTYSTIKKIQELGRKIKKKVLQNVLQNSQAINMLNHLAQALGASPQTILIQALQTFAKKHRID